MKMVTVWRAVHPQGMVFKEELIEVSDGYVDVKDKYIVGYTSPKIGCKPRTGSRKSAAQRRHLMERYKFGAHTPERLKYRVRSK